MTQTRAQKMERRYAYRLWLRERELSRCYDEINALNRKMERFNALLRQDDAQRAEIQRLTEENERLRHGISPP